MENRIRQKASPSRFLKTVKKSPMKSSFNSMAAVTIPLPASLSASFHPESGQLQNSVPAAAPRSRKKDSQNPGMSFPVSEISHGIPHTVQASFVPTI